MNGFDEILELQHKLLDEIKSYAQEKFEQNLIYKLGSPIHIVGNISAVAFEVEDLSDDNYDIYFYCESKDGESFNSTSPGLYLYDLNVYQLSWALQRLRKEDYYLLTLNQQ